MDIAVGGRLVNGLKLGIGQIVTVPHHAAIDFEVGDAFSFAAWLYIHAADSTYGNMIFSKSMNGLISGEDGTGYFFNASQSFCGISQRYRNSNFRRKISTHSIPINTRFHLVGTVTGTDPNNFQNYLNGAVLTGTVTDGTLPTIKCPDDATINHYLDKLNIVSTHTLLNLEIFNKALTATEAKYLYDNEGKIPDTALANLVEFWGFPEKNGKVLHGRLGHHGDLQNYTNAETANAGQPQSGNTAWVNAYTRLPITI